MPRPTRIFLTGFSGTGKSLVARLAAQNLNQALRLRSRHGESPLATGQGWRAMDTDDLVEAMAGRPIAAIFARQGEAAFRELEAEALRQAASQERVVVGAGGGAVLREENRRLMAQGFVVCLEARPETILARLGEEQGSERPLLAGPDPSTGSRHGESPLATGQAPLGRIRSLKAQRQPLYALADHTVHTDGLAPEEVAAEVVRAWRRLAPRLTLDPARWAYTGIPSPSVGEGQGEGESPPPSNSLPPGEGGSLRQVSARLTAAAKEPFADATCVVRTPSRAYPVYVGWDALAELGPRMREAGLAGRAHLVSDSEVFPRYGQRALESLQGAGLEAAAFVVPAGEESKSLAMASRLYEWLAGRRAERGEATVALGGGVVGDLAGFVAATYARGLPLVQVPTSLLAMVDAAIGGKTAVNLPQAKNLVGAFHQPHLVVADVAALRTLPHRDLTAGWAELIKHALIQDPALLAFLEERAGAIAALEPGPCAEAVARSIAVKARIVEADEREEGGLRSLLNYGHTIGHALEAAAGYQGLLHGEAVALGMIGAARISRRLGLLPPEEEERQADVLGRFGLPCRIAALPAAVALDPQGVLAPMALDKKVRRQAIHWVLLEALGRPILRSEVPPQIVEEVVRELIEP